MIGSLLNKFQAASATSNRQLTLPAIWQWLTSNGRKILPARDNRRLRVAESVSLGDRRFVVLLEADGEHFLVGASAAGVSLLTRLPGAPQEHSAVHPAADHEGDGRRVAAEPFPITAASTDMPVRAWSTVPEAKADEPVCFHEALERASAGPAESSPSSGGGQPAAAVQSARNNVPASPPQARRHAFPIGVALAAAIAVPLLLTPRVHAVQAPAASRSVTSSAKTSSSQGTLHSTNSSTPTATASNTGLSLTGLGSSSAPWTIVVLLTVLTLIPSLMICMTPFARLLVVFHFLRQALGLQTTPSNQTLIGLSLILTFFIMQPLGKQIYTGSVVPLQNGQITALEAVDRGSEPLRHFMAHYVREKDAALFLEIAHAPQPKSIDDVSLRVLMPAYIVSELKAGFQIGAVLFLPFLVVDIVIASITTSVGMMQLPPVVISTPLKLMLFLMVDGWHLLIGALVRSFY